MKTSQFWYQNKGKSNKPSHFCFVEINETKSPQQGNTKDRANGNGYGRENVEVQSSLTHNPRQL